ncbi:MAG: hypothetical protein H6621_03315 [Halobacteriovoraceae bacterium]|nr:hypothetical protein [Halobacteriovoraceae bacterium]MCB9094076.1 hypothetical protein [Halobacteriovoraceae bacterium]
MTARINTHDSINKLFSGLYRYERNKKKYADEYFEIYENYDSKNILYHSTFMSRLQTGQFLSVESLYELNDKFRPVRVAIDRRVGIHEVSEEFAFSKFDRGVKYSFRSKDTQISKDIPAGKTVFIMTPSFLTKTIFAIHRKYGTSARIPYTVIRSENLWQFNKVPAESHLYVTFDTQNMKPVIMGNEEYDTFTIHVYEQDTWSEDDEKPIVLTIAKDLSIPFESELEDGTRIQIVKLNKFFRTEKVFKI